MQPKRRKKSRRSKNEPITAVVANAAGEIFELPGYAAVGMAGEALAPLTLAQTLPMPFGSELMFLPDRIPILYDQAGGRLTPLAENPYEPGEPIYPVAAFNSPGYVITAVSAYRERDGAGLLPLFSYGAVGWHGNGFRSALVQVDWEPRQDLRRMPLEKIHAGVKQMQKQLPGNRLRAPPGKMRPDLRVPGGEKFFPWPVRGAPAHLPPLQRPMPGVYQPPGRRAGELQPATHRFYPDAGGDRPGGPDPHRAGGPGRGQLRPGV